MATIFPAQTPLAELGTATVINRHAHLFAAAPGSTELEAYRAELETRLAECTTPMDQAAAVMIRYELDRY